MSLVLYRKYRPSDFNQVVGQEHIVGTIKNAVKNNRVAHAYLFSGPRGTGKTSIARILAKAVNCENPTKDGEPCNKCQTCQDINNGKFLDLMEIDAATHTQVDKMREIVERINFSPSKGKKKVYIIDEVHMLSRGAFNALLKTLEEPPEHVLFILATTEIHKIPATIISRCQRFDFRHLRVEEIKNRLLEIAKEEKIEVEDKALEYVAISSGGGMRDSESIFGQIIALQDDKKITLKEVQDILAVPDDRVFFDFVNLILDKKYADAVSYIDDISDSGYDLAQFNKGVLEYLRRILLIKINPQIDSHFSSHMTQEQISELRMISEKTNVLGIFKTISSFVKSQSSIKGSVFPQLPIELAIVEIQISDESFCDKPLTKQQNKYYNSEIGVEKDSEKQNIGSSKKESKAKEEEEEQEDGGNVENEGEVLESDDGGNIPQSLESEGRATNSVENTSFDLEDLKSEWGEVVEDVRQCNNSLVACLKTCQPIDIRDGIVLVSCQYSFYRDKLQKPENRKAVEDVACDVLKCSCVKMKFVDKEEAVSMGYEIKDKIVKDNKSEDLVSSAINMFGGELVAE